MREENQLYWHRRGSSRRESGEDRRMSRFVILIVKGKVRGLQEMFKKTGIKSSSKWEST